MATVRQSKPIKYMQLTLHNGQLVAIHWPDCKYEFALGHDYHHAIETNEEIFVFFTNDRTILTSYIDSFFELLKAGQLTWLLVDMRSASNPINERQPAMSRKAKK